MLTTVGNSSIGIFAQSVGGGGGVKGETDSSPTGALIGSGGGVGVAGTVQVTVNGTIRTSGDSADGMFAQAASGSGSSSTIPNVSVNLGTGATIAVSGSGANGIYAQSSGGTMGAVTVSLASGASVQGGAPATQSGEYDGAGIFINQGSSSAIQNAGTISSVSGVSGVAIRGVSTDLTITNTGTITGQVIGGTVSTGDATITLDNQTPGTLNAGPRIEADVVNAGLMTINGTSAFNQTQITGTLVQASTGTLRINVDFNGQIADLLSVDGSASLGGHIALLRSSTLPDRFVPIVTANGGLTLQGLTVDPSALFGFGVTQSGNQLSVAATSADFQPSGVALTRSERSVAAGLQSVWDAGGNAAFGVLFNRLDSDAGGSGAAYARDLYQLSPGASLAIGARQPVETENFANAMLSCPEFSGQPRSCRRADAPGRG